MAHATAHGGLWPWLFFEPPLKFASDQRPNTGRPKPFNKGIDKKNSLLLKVDSWTLFSKALGNVKKIPPSLSLLSHDSTARRQ